MGFLEEVKKHRQAVSEELYSRVLAVLKGDPMEFFSSKPKISQLARPFFIGEVKPVSPSRGFISTIDWLQIKENYFHVDAVSVLTEEKHFLGSFFNLLMASVVFEDKPILGKDFVVSLEQLELMKKFGATNYLIIVDMLEEDEIRFILNNDEPLEPLFEVRSMKDIELAEKFGARVVGVNSRNLKSLEVSHREILPLVEEARKRFEVVIVESGISQPEDVRIFSGMADGVLVGTALMKDISITEKLAKSIKNSLKGGI